MAYSHYFKISTMMGVKGDTKGKYDGWIEVLSYSFGGSNPVSLGSATGGGAGKVSYSDLHLMINAGDMPNALVHFLHGGGYVDSATLASARPGRAGLEELMRVDLIKVFRSNLQYNGSTGGDDLLTVSFSLSFEKSKLQYGVPKDPNPPNPAVQNMLLNAVHRGYKRIPPWQVK